MDLADVNQKMQRAVEFTRADIAVIRTGRANPALVENVMINAYGGTARLKVMELGTLSVPEANMIVITPYDQSIAGDIRRDLEAANLGVTPVLDNGIIRITFPPLTEERRLEYVKMLHVKLEDGRVKIRQVRHEKMSEFKRLFEDGTLPEDDRYSLEEELQKVTDKMMEEIEKLGKVKQEELMKI
ncbi:MAG: ribosome recycling factor [Microgenomates group bacterium Gr01-1014_16]|nr:MAG: ribosome recycling factor [Microgenomates group bacterium Gr01-1014_16]